MRMHNVHRQFWTVVLFCALFTSALAAGESVSLFDGKSLDGWEGNAEIWSASDGMIVGKTAGIRHNQFLCTTREFQDFELQLEFRLVNGVGNTGVQIRSERVPNSTEVSGYQADLGEMFWGGLYDESRRNLVLACPDPVGLRARLDAAGSTMAIQDMTPSPELDAFRANLKTDGWNTYTIRADGPRITLRINGHLTVDYRERETEYVKPGVIGLQVHSGGPLEVHFRSLQLTPLD